MKALLITISLFLSVAHAGDRSSAYNAICKPMTFETERAECMAVIKKYSYFDDAGLAFCKSLNFDTNKMSCLVDIADKMYERYEIDHCLSLMFDSEKQQCLKESGVPYDRDGLCVPREETINELSSGIRDMRNGKLKAADQRLSYLLNRFISCPNR